MAILSFSGRIGSGKDTAGQIAQILLNSPQLSTEGVMAFLKKGIGTDKSEYYPGWEIKKFADKLKDMVCMLLNVDRETLEDREFKEKELGEEWWYWKETSSYSNMVELYSYSQYKQAPSFPHCELIKLTPRLLLQLLGTECGRQIIHPNIWVNALMSEYKPLNPGEMQGMSPPYTLMPDWIITDMRFPNELKAVEDRNGITLRLFRGVRNYDPTLHESETALDNAEFDYVVDNNGSIEDLIKKIKEILIKEDLL